LVVAVEGDKEGKGGEGGAGGREGKVKERIKKGRMVVKGGGGSTGG
jgi:hypothetical protein